MAVKRALVFRVGAAGPTCAATEVAIEKGTLSKPGSLRPIGACTKPATVTWQAPDGSLTGLCVEHRDQVQRSSSIGAIDVQRRRGRAEVAVVRGLGFTTDAGTDICFAVELALEVSDDYADAATAKVIDACGLPATFVWRGSGLCAVHRNLLRPEGGYALN